VLLSFTDRFLTAPSKYPVAQTESRVLTPSSAPWQPDADANASTLSDFTELNRVDMIAQFSVLWSADLLFSTVAFGLESFPGKQRGVTPAEMARDDRVFTRFISSAQDCHICDVVLRL
jgi:hypothetical protein